MNYAYDLVLNYCNLENSCEFYEWKKKDICTYIQKMPIFKIDILQMEDLLCSYLKINSSFLEKIYNKTISIQGRISYSALFTDSFRIYAFQFNSNGDLIKRSSLLIDEGCAVMDEVEDLEITCLDYKIIKRISCSSFLTREEKKIQSYLLSEIKSLYKNRKYDEIDYLYQEFFSENKTIYEKYRSLLYKIKYHYCEDYFKLYEIIELAHSS